MAEERVLRAFEQGVLTLTLNRPDKKNAFDDSLWDAFSAALIDARADSRVAVVLVTGAGGNFSAGQDLSAFGGPPREDGKMSGYYGFMDALIAFDKPLVAAATGVGIGIGATFLFHCDLVFVGESVRLRLPFVRLGLVPEAASSYLLPLVVGPRKAAEMLFTAEWIHADQAVATGIATAVCPDAELLAVASARAREIARFPVGSLQATKRTLMVAHGAAIRAALAAEDEGMMKQAGSPENLEAISAFMEKREPDFTKLHGQG